VNAAGGTDARGAVDSPALRVLGPVLVRTGTGEVVEPTGRRVTALLVALALAAPAPVSTAALIDDVWGDEAPRGAKAALQTLVSRLRSVAGDELVGSAPSGYRLRLDTGGTDLGAVERAATAAGDALARGDAALACSLVHGALELWRGDPGGDLDDGPLLDALVRRAATAEHALAAAGAAAALELGHAAAAEEFALRLTRGAPFDDSAHLLLMRALDALGRPTEAVGVYADFRVRVQEAFGTSPSRELQALNLELVGREPAVASEPWANAVVRAHSVDEPEDSPAVRTVTRGATVVRGLRAAPNELLGRDTSIAEIEQLIARSRVTTVLGAGGLGKTRVAQEVAARAVGDVDAVFVVELAGVRSGDDVLFAIASALGIREASSSRLSDQVVRADLRTRIVSRLDGGRVLLVVDNCEHIVDAAAEWCSALIAELPGLTVLTTSRTPLSISSERVYALPPLGRAAAPGRSTGGSADAEALAADPAVRLFVDRATAARPEALLPLETVGRLCDRLDGLPLAIELAAARIRSLPLDEIERRLSNRFALLTGGDRSAPERHRTLTAVIEWSWNLLARGEQRALARLSEFASGFSPEAAREVVGGGELQVGDLLDGLVAQSLITVVESAAGLRYRMLETVREFGQAKLAEAGAGDEVQDALFGWAERYSERQRRRMDGRDQVAAFDDIAVEEDNLIDVLRRAIDAGRSATVASVFALLGYFWSLRSAHSEVIAFSEPVFRALAGYRPEDELPGEERPEDEHERDERLEQLTVTLLLIAGTTILSDLRFAVRPLSRLRRLAAVFTPEDTRLRAMTSLVLAVGDESRVRTAIENAISSPDHATALFGTMVGSLEAENEGRRDQAVALSHRTVRLAEDLDDTWGEAMGSQMLGALHSQSGEPVEALHWARRALVALTRLGAAGDVRQTEWVIASNQVAVGELDEARAGFERLVAAPGQTDDGIDMTAIGLSGLAEISRAERRPDEARAFYRRALDTFDRPRLRSSPWYRVMLSAALASSTVDGTGTAEERRRLARRLRSRILAGLRSSEYVDRPIIGAAVVGLAVWADDAGTLPHALPLELLALAEAMAARQDTTALHLPPLFERLGRTEHPETIANARAAATALPHDERPRRAAELLRTPGPWSWGWQG
jgi:predicted ATPase/DNA-binding SARP family transcriptional activator